jgi:hypothetical protein
MTGNYPCGFDGFQARIEAVTEMLGGTLFARMEVEREFVDALQIVLRRRLGDGERLEERLEDRRDTWWTAATDEDFAAAVAAETRFRGHAPAPESGRWRVGPAHGDAVLRGADLWLETAGGHILLAFGVKHDARSWRIRLTAAGEDLLAFLGRLAPERVLRFWSEAAMLRFLREIAAVHMAAP